VKIRLAPGEHPRVQLRERRDLRDGHQMTAAEAPHLTLDAALFVCPLDTRDRELRLIHIVRAQRDKPVSLHTLTAAQHLLDRAREIVIAHQAEYPAKPVKRVDMSLQERLLGAVRERHRERRTRVTRTHVKQVNLRRASGHPDLRLTPVHLALHARLTDLRHERLSLDPPHKWELFRPMRCVK
jgi:hypothetical protein